MRILRVLRGLKSARALTHFLVGRRAESAFLASVLITLLPRVLQHRRLGVRDSGWRQHHYSAGRDVVVGIHHDNSGVRRSFPDHF